MIKTFCGKRGAIRWEWLVEHRFSFGICFFVFDFVYSKQRSADNDWSEYGTRLQLGCEEASGRSRCEEMIKR